jgi:hypothetical protein
MRIQAWAKSRPRHDGYQQYLASLTPPLSMALDIDANGTVDPETDGLLRVSLLAGCVATRWSRTWSATAQPHPQPDRGSLATDRVDAATRAPHDHRAADAVMASPLAPGTQVQLTAYCPSGAQPITYTWSDGGFVGAVRAVSPMTTTTYSDVGSNNGGSAPAVSSTVYTSASTNYCVPGDQLRDLVYPPTGGQLKSSTQGMRNSVVSFRVVIPFTFNPPLNINHTGYVSAVGTRQRRRLPRDDDLEERVRLSCAAGGYLADTVGFPDRAADRPHGKQSELPSLRQDQREFRRPSTSISEFLDQRRRRDTDVPGRHECDILVDFAWPNRY